MSENWTEFPFLSEQQTDRSVLDGRYRRGRDPSDFPGVYLSELLLDRRINCIHDSAFCWTGPNQERERGVGGYRITKQQSAEFYDSFLRPFYAPVAPSARQRLQGIYGHAPSTFNQTV